MEGKNGNSISVFHREVITVFHFQGKWRDFPPSPYYTRSSPCFTQPEGTFARPLAFLERSREGGRFKCIHPRLSPPPLISEPSRVWCHSQGGRTKKMQSATLSFSASAVTGTDTGAHIYTTCHVPHKYAVNANQDGEGRGGLLLAA